jgi:hypothetical protein
MANPFHIRKALKIKESTEIDAILDEDDLSSDSETALATQQSIKAFVDTEIANINVVQGSDTHVQINDGGVLGSDANFTWDKTGQVLTLGGDVVASAGIKVGAYGQTVSAGAIQWDGSNFQGYDGSTWVDLDSSGSVVGGSDTHIQFNDGGVVNGDADLTWNKTSNILTLGGNAKIVTGAETSPDVGNGGICIQQATDTGRFFTIKGTQVSHDFGALDETDTYASFRRYGATVGGLEVNAYSNTNYGFVFNAHATTPFGSNDTQPGMFMFNIYMPSGGNRTVVPDNVQGWTFRNNDEVKCVIKASGDIVSSGGIKLSSWEQGNSAGAIQWDGSNFQGYNGSTWVDLDASVSGLVAGSDTQVQYNDSGSFGASSSFTYNDTSKQLEIRRTDATTDPSILKLSKGRGTGMPAINDNIGKISFANGAGTEIASLSVDYMVTNRAELTYVSMTTGTYVMKVTTGGTLILGNPSGRGVNDVAEAGLVIHHAWDSDTSTQNFFTVTSRYVNHGFTTVTDGNTFLEMRTITRDYGGVHLDAFAQFGGPVALILQGNTGNAYDNTAEAHFGAVQIIGTQQSGTDKGALGNNEQLFDIRNHTSNRLSMNGLGDVYLWNGGIKPGANATATNGMIRFTGTDLEVYISGWQSLTGSTSSAPGADTQIIFNNAGTEDGSSDLTWIDGSSQLRLGTSAKISTGNEASPDVDGGGITLQQNASDGRILTLKSTDVNHLFTSLDEADTYAAFSKYSATQGSLKISGYGEASQGIWLDAHAEAPSGVDTATGILTFNVTVRSGSGAGTVSDVSQGWVFSNNEVVKALIKGSGDFITGAGIKVGTYGQTASAGAIQWDGSNFQGYDGSSWVDLDASGGSAGGSDTHVQFNNGGSFGGDADLTWNQTTNVLTLGGNAKIVTGGETSPDVGNGGICIQQTTDTGRVLTLKSTQVSHAFSALDETDTYASFRRYGATVGGLEVNAYSDTNYGFVFNAHALTPFGSNDTQPGMFMFNIYMPSGGNRTVVPDNVQGWTFRNNDEVKCVIKASGDIVSSGGIKLSSWEQGNSAGAIQWDGSNFQGYNGSTWVDLDASVSGLVAGSDTQVQYNDSGSFGASSSFTYNDTSKQLEIRRTDATTNPSILKLSKGRGTGMPAINDSIGKISFANGAGTEIASLSVDYTVTNRAELTYVSMTTGTYVMKVTTGGTLILGNPSGRGVNDVAEAGLVIHHAWDSDTSTQNFFTVTSRWVNHGFTTVTDGNTFLEMRTISQDYGGVHLDAFTQFGGPIALILQGNTGNAYDNIAEANFGAVQIIGTQRSGTDKSALGNNEQLFDIRNHTNNRLSMNGLGDVYLWNGGIRPGANATATNGMIRFNGSALQVYINGWKTVTVT